MSIDFWKKEMAKITNNREVIDPYKIQTTSDEEKPLSREKTSCTIFYNLGNRDSSHDEVFTSFGWALRDEYNRKKTFGLARSAGMTSGRAIVTALNNKDPNDLQRLDLIGHGDPTALLFSHEWTLPNFDFPIPMGQSLEHSGLEKRNLYMSFTAMNNDSQIGLSAGTGAASIDEIDYSIFKKDAVIEFHACNTAGRPSYDNWNDTSVWLFKEDNIAYWMSKLLYANGKTKAVVIGHYAGAGPGSAYIRDDYRQDRRIVFHNGSVLLDTQKNGELWHDIKKLL